MIAVIGRPAQRQFGQIARANDQAAVFVGHVHQHLCALARLTVFVGHVVRVHVLADVLEVLLDRLADRRKCPADRDPARGTPGR